MEGQAGAVGASDAEGVRSLDLGTQLPSAGHWLAKGYPQAGEASIAYVGTGGGSEESAWSQLEADERRSRNHKRASQRAKGETRRYLVANRLRYMWVLTFSGEGLHGPEGRAECMRRVAAFAERLTAAFGRQPYWYSPEIHPGGHGWHVNFFVRHRLNHGRVETLWEHGHVWVKDWTQDTRIKSLGLPVVAAIRLGATYGCKYASKDWSEEALAGGAHRYEVAQGY
jgi:hypothetical protein